MGRARWERPVSLVAGEGRGGDRSQHGGGGGGGGARPRDTRAEELRCGGLRVLVLLPLSWPTLPLALSAGLPFPGPGLPRLPPTHLRAPPAVGKGVASSCLRIIAVLVRGCTN